MKAVGFIPSRIGSSRFPGKPLIDIEGLPMIIHVLRRAELCKSLAGVYVATDSREIFQVVSKFNGRCIMTSSKHKTGTDRIAEAADKVACDIAVNIQGDEPLVKPKDIDKLVAALKTHNGPEVATLICKTPEFGDLTECKVVTDLHNNILYMSREDIPSSARREVESLYKLYCIVAFRKKFLRKFSEWLPTPLEKAEYIEYLRILEHGYKIKGVIVKDYTTSLDTPDNLAVIKKMMKKDKVKNRYLKKETK